MTVSINSVVGSAVLGMPEGKTRVLLQFNKITGAYIMTMSWVDPATLNNDHYIYAEAEVDFQNDVVIGKYPNHQIVHRDVVKPKVVESILEASLRGKITKRYTVVKQVNIISDAVVAIADALAPLISETDEKVAAAVEALLEMRDYINDVKQIHDSRVEYYKNSTDFDFISKEDEAVELEEQLEGGLHEVYGPREASGGSVF